MTGTTEDATDELHRQALDGYQLLQTLVSIRMRSVSDPESRRHLAWLGDVVAGLDLLNRRMTASGTVDFLSYLDDVAAFWGRSGASNAIRLEVRGEAAIVPDSRLLPLAIIVHELMANAFRHAFPNGRSGVIAVAFSRAVGGVSLVVRDSGVGSDGVAPREGLKLVEGLVAHVDGFMQIETAPGAGFAVRIRLPLQGISNH